MYKIHHIGRVVNNLTAELNYYRSVGFEIIEGVKKDPYHKVKVGLVNLGPDILLELLEPDGDKSPVKNFLLKGGGLHHICYQVADLDKQMKFLRQKGVTLSKPTPSVFDKKKVFFFYTAQKEIIEFIES